MVKPVYIVRLLLGLAVAGILAFAGMMIPAQFRAASPEVIASAGRDTPDAQGFALEFLNAGKTGPARLLIGASHGRKWAQQLLSEAEQLEQRFPNSRISGGSAPYFDQFLQWIDPASIPAEAKVAEILLPGENRGQLLAFLANSSRPDVLALLETRELTGYTQFMPVHTAAGHPLDAVILMTALLAQGENLHPGLVRALTGLAAGAATDSMHMERLEDAYLSLLTAGRRFDWLQLAAITRNCETRYSLRDAARLLRAFPGREDTLGGAIIMGAAPGALLDYLSQFPEEGFVQLERMMNEGAGAVTTLIADPKPLYRMPQPLHRLEAVLGRLRPLWVLDFAARHRASALILKTLAFMLAGYAFALGFGGLFYPRPLRARRKRSSLFAIEGVMTAVLVTGFCWLAIEPALLQFAPRGGADIHLDFNAAAITATDEPITENAMFDQVTLIILLIFFIAQLMVYVFGILKVGDIRKQGAAADLKLKLLDNEDNLFDLGLYIGLGGTVASLIMLAMDIAAPSLIAAYSSTLFGIIFTAILKVGHVRPYRRALIVEHDGDSTPPTEQDTQQG